MPNSTLLIILHKYSTLTISKAHINLAPIVDFPIILTCILVYMTCLVMLAFSCSLYLNAIGFWFLLLATLFMISVLACLDWNLCFWVRNVNSLMEDSRLEYY